MTEEQKEILIAKMLDAASSLSDEELDLIVQDDELHEIYEASAVLSSVCIRQPELDMKAEWESFLPRIRRKPSIMSWGMRVAAIFLGILFVSSIVIKIIDDVFTEEQPSAIANVEKLPEVHHTSVALQIPQQVEASKEKAEKETPIERHTSLANHHLSQTKERQSKTGATQIETNINIDEYLRVQQARIDNELALQVAESYIEEYDNLIMILDATGSYNPALDNMIRKVTME